jgi:hypothetical protein
LCLDLVKKGKRKEKKIKNEDIAMKNKIMLK